MSRVEAGRALPCSFVVRRLRSDTSSTPAPPQVAVVLRNTAPTQLDRVYVPLDITSAPATREEPPGTHKYQKHARPRKPEHAPGGHVAAMSPRGRGRGC